MHFDPAKALKGAFLDELEKIAVSKHRLHVAQTRKGRRPMAVATLLRKEKDGTLYKKAQFYGPAQPFAAGPADPAAARHPKKKGDVPSKDDTDSVHRLDQRESAATVVGPGYSYTNIGASNLPAEHS